MRPVLLALALLAGNEAAATVRFALVAGNNLGGDDERVLRWAEKDARRTHQLMIELGSVHPRRAQLLLGADPNRLQLELAHLRGQVEEAKRHGQRTEVFVYYAGHGDRDSLHLGNRFLPLATLEQWLGEIPADAMLTVLDACRSGPVRSGGGRGARAAPGFDVRVARQAGPSGRVLIQAAGSDEVAQESDDLEGGFFTHHLLIGLRGAADFDRDKRVTVAEAYRYAYHRTLSTSFGTASATQHATMAVKLEGEGELVVTSLGQAGATLVLSPELTGELLVVDDASARVVAELRLSGGQRLELALPPGEYRLIRREGGRVYAGRVTLQWSRTQTVNPAALAEQPRLAALQRGARWDPTPWRIYAAGSASLPRALGTGTSLGGRLNLERRLGGPFFWTLGIAGATAAADGTGWTLRHSELSAGGGLGAGWTRGPLRAQAAVSLEAAGIHATGRRHQAQRLAALGFSPLELSGWTVGPGVGGDLHLALALHRGLEARLGAGGSLAWVKVDGAVKDAVTPFAHLGVGYGF